MKWSFFSLFGKGITEEKKNTIITNDFLSVPNFPERWLMPASEIKRGLKDVVVEDFDENDNPIKRSLTTKEIIKLTKHWNKKVEYSKKDFTRVFDKDIIKFRPFVRFVNFCESGICETLADKVIRSSDPRAALFFPPLFPGCLCSMVTHSKSELDRDGYVEKWQDIDLSNIFLFVRQPVNF